MSEVPLIPAALYGLRTWRVAGDARGEHLIGAYDDAPWPDGGAWLHASCERGGDHAAPAAGCLCGIHAWHPDRGSARRVLGRRFDVPGIVEVAGAIEVHEEGFRAQRGRPLALVVLPGRNARLVARLAERYRAELVEVTGPDALLAWCRIRALGLDAPAVARLLGDGAVLAHQEERRRNRRRDALRAAGTVAVAGALLSAGLAFASGPPSPHGVFGRTGWVVRPRAPACPATTTPTATTPTARRPATGARGASGAPAPAAHRPC
jgi:hypothetical protein